MEDSKEYLKIPEVTGEVSMKELMRAVMDLFEERLVSKALSSAEGDLGKAATLLRIHNRSLRNKMLRFNLGANGERPEHGIEP